MILKIASKPARPQSSGSVSFLLHHRRRPGAATNTSERIVEFFYSPARAFSTMIILLIVVAAAYHLWHVSISHNWFNSDAKPNPNTRPWANAIHVSKDGLFDLNYNQGVLERYFAVPKINELKQRLDERRLVIRKKFDARRRFILEEEMLLAQRGASDRIAPKFLITPRAEVKEADFQLVPLSGAEQWLRDAKSSLETNRVVQAEMLLNAFTELRSFQDDEIKNLQQEVEALEPALSFAWVNYLDDGWIKEVVFWSLFGALANTIIALIQFTRARKYSPSEFVLVFPKLIVAPLIAIFFVILWVSGFSGSGISYLNLPYFLLFAFILGFFTEDLYAKLRDIGKLILASSATLSEAKMAEAARREPYQFISPPAAADTVAPPRTLQELGQTLQQVGKAQVERGLIAQLSANP